MSDSMDAIRCQALSRSYGEVLALKSLELSVPRGAVFGFLGRNGAGKTTTIRLMTGLARPSSGDAWIMGVKTTDGDDTAKMNFGYLPEEPAFYTWMTPREYLAYIGKLFGLNKDVRQTRIEELLDLAGLLDAAKRRIGGFSRGMRQRLGLAQSMIHRPPVLFLDEPTSALDPAGRKDVLEMIDRLRGETTVFLSSHILADVERVCDTIGVIHEGELLLVAGREELLATHALNVVVIEFDSNDLPVSPLLLSRLGEISWISSVLQEKNGLRIQVSDSNLAKKALLPLILESEVTVISYQWVRPSLEDVFLSISTR
ncbi:MAG TPA: ABC transporter ATP-binding protein [Chloroflexi bacterium]|nr:ABC transporter ATP-binding protein [Chloroflexota bacterium]